MDYYEKPFYTLKTTGERKVQTTICISKELYDIVKRIAPKIYGVKRGALSRAVEDGLR